MERSELVNQIRMAMLRLVLDIPDEVIEKALENTINDIRRETPEACCDNCKYTALRETDKPCCECMYSHRNLWEAQR